MKRSVDEKPSNELIERIKEWSVKSKIHGLDHLVLSRNLTLKIIWLISLIISLAICSLTIANSIIQYKQYEIKTKMREVYLDQLTFPEVGICNSNPLVTPTANKFIQSYILEKFNLSISKYSDVYKHIKDELLPSDELEYILYTTYDPAFDALLRKKFGYWDFYIECYFGVFDCKTDWYYHSSKGNCLKLNSSSRDPKSKRLLYNVIDPKTALNIVMYTGSPDENESYLYQPESKGLFISVDENETFQFVESGIGVKAGFIAQIVVSKTLTENLPIPYSNCLDSNSIDTVLSREMARIGLKYTRKNCLFLCQQKQNIDQIGCNDMRKPRLFNAPLCYSKELYQKIKTLVLNMSMCFDLCPIECSFVTYDLSVSYLEYPSYNSFYSYLNTYYDEGLTNTFETENITYERVKKSVAGARIFFKEIKYREFTQLPKMSIVDLVAIIGGTLGLFLGVSVMMFVEIMELIIEILYIIFKNSYRKPLNVVNNNKVEPDANNATNK